MTEEQKDSIDEQIGELESALLEIESAKEKLETYIEEVWDDAQTLNQYAAVLERFADHRNWTPERKYAPAIKELDDHPADVAARVLRENT